MPAGREPALRHRTPRQPHDLLVTPPEFLRIRFRLVAVRPYPLILLAALPVTLLLVGEATKLNPGGGAPPAWELGAGLGAGFGLLGLVGCDGRWRSVGLALLTVLVPSIPLRSRARASNGLSSTT
jgi:hypothetical protein